MHLETECAASPKVTLRSRILVPMWYTRGYTCPIPRALTTTTNTKGIVKKKELEFLFEQNEKKNIYFWSSLSGTSWQESSAYCKFSNSYLVADLLLQFQKAERNPQYSNIELASCFEIFTQTLSTVSFKIYKSVPLLRIVWKPTNYFPIFHQIMMAWNCLQRWHTIHYMTSKEKSLWLVCRSNVSL